MMNEKQFFKDLYYFEHQRRSKLTTNLGVPIPSIQKAQAANLRQEVRPMYDEQKRNDKPAESPPPKPEPPRIQIIKEHKEKPEEPPKND